MATLFQSQLKTLTRLAPKSSPPVPGIEGLAATDDQGVINADELGSRLESGKVGLKRIIKEYLDDKAELHMLVNQMFGEGSIAVKNLRHNGPKGLLANPDHFASLEAIIRTDDSRPTFLVRNGEVDLNSFPAGNWKSYIQDDQVYIKAALACVGRIDIPTSTGYMGTGFLIASDLIITNRHVLQGIANDGANGWTFKYSTTTIDFGHEYRGISSITPRKLKRVAFAGKTPINPSAPVNHAALDLAAIELEPGESPSLILSVRSALDWTVGNPDVYVIGYPGKPLLGSYSPTLLDKLFQGLWGYKRFAPGSIIPQASSIQPWTLGHDATTLGGNSGSAVFGAGRAAIAAGLHYGGQTKPSSENWGHVLGHALSAADARGNTLSNVFAKHNVVITP